MKIKTEKGTDLMRKLFLLNERDKKIFFIITIYSLLFVFPIILADVYYVDDIGRSMSGHAAWIADGRPLMMLMAVVISNGNSLLPVFPVPLLISVILLDYTLVLLVKKYIKGGTIYSIGLPLCLIFSNWFLLENFSYSFEALGMIIALCLFFLLFAFFDCITKHRYIVSFFICFCALSIYQAVLGAYLSLLLLESAYLAFQNERIKYIVIRIGKKILPLIAAVFAYKVFFHIWIIVTHSEMAYAAAHAGVVHIFSQNGLANLSNNIMGFTSLLESYFYSFGKIPSIILLVCYFCFTFTICRKYWKNTYKYKSFKIFMCLFFFLLPFILILFSILPFIFLQAPVFAPRVMLSLTVFFLYVSYMMFSIIREYRWGYIVTVLFLLINLSFSAAYGMILNREDKHDSQIAQYIVYDLNQIENETQTRYSQIVFLGSSVPCHELQTAGKKRPLLNRLIPIYMNNDWYWGKQYLKHYRKDNIDAIKATDEDRQIPSLANPVKNNEFYKIYIEGDRAIIVFPRV